MAYTALYRKWRPSDFNDVKGQDHIVKTLQNQIKAERIGHAYLFCGTRGTGKTSVAKIFAKAVNCEHPVDGNPCGECAACKAIAAGNSMNVIEIDAASNNGVENIRQIRDEVQYSPTEGKYKVYIIDEVHMLSIGAFNALLKTLEEPPEYVIFILATTEAHKIPITILSRCQRYDFRRISIDTIANRLAELMVAEKINVEDKAIKYVAKAADGSLRDALSLLDQCIAFYLGKDLKYENVLDVLGAVDVDVYARLLGFIAGYDTTACMNLLEEVVMQGRDLTQFVNDFVWYLRNLLLVKTTDDTSKIEDIIDASAESIEQIKKDSNLADTDTIMRYIRIMSELAGDMKYATNKRIKVEVTLIKLTRPQMETDVKADELEGRIANLESQLQDAISQIKSGNFVMASQNVQPEKPVEPEKPKRVVEALPEDVEKIVGAWDTIVSSIEEPIMVQYLKTCNVTLAEDGRSLELVPTSKVAYEKLSDQAEKEKLAGLIEERTGFSVNIICSDNESDEDFRKHYTDIKELVSIPIEIDDKEELI